MHSKSSERANNKHSTMIKEFISFDTHSVDDSLFLSCESLTGSSTEQLNLSRKESHRQHASFREYSSSYVEDVGVLLPAHDSLIDKTRYETVPIHSVIGTHQSSTAFITDFWTHIVDQDQEDIALLVERLGTQPRQSLVSKLRAGIQPSNLRGPVWQALSHSDSLHLGTLYEQLKNEPTPYEKLIRRDITRTFPNSEFFSKEAGQIALERILRAYSLYDADVGYCQGLAFLVGPLLVHMPEEKAFCVFVRLMETFGMRTLFTVEMEGLHLCLFQFSALLSELLPELAQFLDNHTIHPQMYASQWFLTIFAYVLPLPLVYRIYDVIFIEGPTETVMRLALSLLQKSAKRIMEFEEFEDIMHHLSTNLLVSYDGNYDAVIEDLVKLGEFATKPNLARLEEEYKILQETKASHPNSTLQQLQNVKVRHLAFDHHVQNPPQSLNHNHTNIVKNTDVNKADTGNHPLETTNSKGECFMLHQQINDLAFAFSEVQKENEILHEQLNSSSSNKSVQFVQPLDLDVSQPHTMQLNQHHSYGCSFSSPGNTFSMRQYCYCELEKLLVLAKMRINDLETKLSEQEYQPSAQPSLRRSSSTRSDCSCSSTISSSSSFLSIALIPSSAYIGAEKNNGYIPLANDISLLKDDSFSSPPLHYTSSAVMLPSAYKHNNTSETDPPNATKKVKRGFYNRFLPSFSS